MEQKDKERLFVLLGNTVLTLVCLTTLITSAAFECDIDAVYLAHIFALICLVLACAFVSTAGGKSGILLVSKILSWAGLLGLIIAGLVIAAQIAQY